MAHGYHLRFILIAAACTVLGSPSLRAQLPSRLERCLPYPTLAQEIEVMRQDTESKIAQGVSAPRIVFVSVDFQGETRLPQALQTQLTTSLKRRRAQFYGFDPAPLLDEFQEVAVRGALRERGYFHAEVDSESHLLSANSRERRYSVTFRITDGLQYRLGDVLVKNTSEPSSPTFFPPAQLRKLVPLRRGELFNVSKIRDGLETIISLYGSRGYLDATIEPDTIVDDDQAVISLILNVDEETQYRIGEVNVFTSNPRVETLLRELLKTGEVFDRKIVDRFMIHYRSILPVDVSKDDVRMSRDVKSGKINITFDFWACPLVQN
jgi:outer membrane protein assembly factor BamA